MRNSSCTAVLVVILTSSMWVTTNALGRPVRQNFYDWEKDFKVTASEFSGGYTRSVQAEYLIHVWARNPQGEDSKVFPTSNESKPHFNEFGKDFWKNHPHRSVYNSGTSASVGGVRLDPHLETVAQNKDFSKKYEEKTDEVPSWAKASAKVDVDPWEQGDRWVEGSLQVKGEAHAVIPKPKGQAYAFSYAGIRLNGKTKAWLSGSVKMKNRKLYRPKRGSGDMRRFIRDPFYFTVFDEATGDILAQDNLFDMTMEFWDTDGLPASEFTWEDDVFTIDALEAEIHFALNDTYTIEEGILDLVISDGVVIESSDTGIFDGLLPTIGSSGELTFALPNEIEFAYNLGSFGDQDVQVELSGDVMGEAYAELVPEQCTLLIWSVLGALAIAASYRR